jgi:hypothetical protein
LFRYDAVVVKHSLLGLDRVDQLLVEEFPFKHPRFSWAVDPDEVINGDYDQQR